MCGSGYPEGLFQSACASGRAAPVSRPEHADMTEAAEMPNSICPPKYRESEGAPSSVWRWVIPGRRNIKLAISKVLKQKPALKIHSIRRFANAAIILLPRGAAALNLAASLTPFPSSPPNPRTSTSGQANRVPACAASAAGYSRIGRTGHD
jgi:hypothetical protein